MKYLKIGIVAAFLFGCTGARPLIVHYDIPPDNPTIVVIPNWLDHANIDLANRVEALMLRFGAVIVERPTLKTTIHTLKKPTSKDDVRESFSKEIDHDLMYASTKADYVVLTYSGRRGRKSKVRVTRRENGRVVAAVTLNPVDADSVYMSPQEKQIYSILARLELISDTKVAVCPKLDRPR